MATPAFQDWVERAKSTRLESIVRERGLKLKTHGANITGPCPVCGGTDRFGIHTGKQAFHCRQCGGEGGGAISFIRFLDQCDFLSAVERLTGEPRPPDGPAPAKRKREAQPGKIDKLYDYVDEIGNLLFQVVRYVPKRFSQRRPDPDYADQWIWNLNGVRLVPYRLPMVTEAIAYEQTVFMVEGEKDAECGARLGVAATTTAMGAGKWKSEQGDHYAAFFRDADVVIIPDNDADPKKGRAHATTIASKLHHVAERVRVLTLPQDCKDLSEWVEQGGTRELLDAMTTTAPDYMNGYDPGGVPVTEPDQPAASPLRIYTKVEFIRGFVPPDYLIDGMLQRRFVYAFTGQTGHAKSAIALLMAELVSSPGDCWLGTHHIEKGQVAYFVGENPDDIRMRVIGADSKRSSDCNPRDDRILFIPGVFNIADMAVEIHTQMQERGGLDFVIVDTSAAYFLGNEELSNTQMGTHARMLRHLTELPGGPCVLVLCHPIKHASEPSHLLPRGGGAFLAEMDGNLTVWKKTETVAEMHHNKIRGVGFQPISFELETVRTQKLVDAKGREIPTVRATVLSEKKETQILQVADSDEDRVLAAMLTENSSYRDIARRWDWWFDDGEPDHSRVQRATIRLANAKPQLIRQNRRKWELTDHGKELAKTLALRFKHEADDAAKREQADLYEDARS